MDIETPDLSKYEISKLQYPVDLSEDAITNRYGNNKVLFFINVNAASRIVREDSSGTVTMPLPTAINASSTEKIKEYIHLLSGTDTALESSLLDLVKPKKRLKAAIALYVPNSLGNSYSVNWNEESHDEMIKGDVTAKALLAIAPDTKNASSGSKIGNIGSLAGSVIGSKMLGGSKYAQKAVGLSPGQSKAEQLFQNVNFREFSFNYNFAPKSIKEAENAFRIIDTFKYHMLPEYFDTAQYLYLYPSEFEVRYYRGTNENPYLDKQVTAVLTSMDIDYTPNGQFTTFANGMPTHVNIKLNFKELALLTKESVGNPLAPRA